VQEDGRRRMERTSGHEGGENGSAYEYSEIIISRRGAGTWCRNTPRIGDTLSNGEDSLRGATSRHQTAGVRRVQNPPIMKTENKKDQGFGIFNWLWLWSKIIEGQKWAQN
jgi:hypothetical protein